MHCVFEIAIPAACVPTCPRIKAEGLPIIGPFIVSAKVSHRPRFVTSRLETTIRLNQRSSASIAAMSVETSSVPVPPPKRTPSPVTSSPVTAPVVASAEDVTLVVSAAPCTLPVVRMRCALYAALIAFASATASAAVVAAARLTTFVESASPCTEPAVSTRCAA